MSGKAESVMMMMTMMMVMVVVREDASFFINRVVDVVNRVVASLNFWKK